MYKFGEIVLATMQFVDSGETKNRPALILFQEYSNVVVAGITSNPETKGISVTKKEGFLVDSIIKMNYIFTITKEAIYKKLPIELSHIKKKEIKEYIINRLQ